MTVAERITRLSKEVEGEAWDFQSTGNPAVAEYAMRMSQRLNVLAEEVSRG